MQLVAHTDTRQTSNKIGNSFAAGVCYTEQVYLLKAETRRAHAIAQGAPHVTAERRVAEQRVARREALHVGRRAGSAASRIHLNGET